MPGLSITLNEQLRPLKDPVEIQEVAVRLIGEHLHASRVNYAHIDGDEFVISRSYADGVPPFAGRGSVARFGKAIVDACRRGETVAVDDVNTDPRFTDAEREQLLAGETAAFVGAPLIKDGRWLATFGVHSATPRTWTRDQIALVEVTAERTWGAGERARAEEALGRSESRQAFLRRLNDTIRPLADPARILHETCRLLGTHLRVNRVAYGEIEGDDCIIVHDYVDGVPSLVGHVQWRNLGGSRTADILKGWTLSVNDTSTESHTAEERAALQAAGIGAYICPLLIKDGRFVGAFGVHSRSPRVWTPDEIALVPGSRRSDLGDARAPQGGSRTARERGAAGVSSPAERRGPPVERCGGHPGNCRKASCEHLGAARVGYAELGGREYIIRREHTRGAEPLVGTPLRIAVRGTLGEALRRGETIVVSDVQADQRLSDDDRAAFRSRQDRGVRRRGAVQRRADGCRVRRQSRHCRACGRPGRSSSFATSPSGPGTPSSAPAPKRHSGNRKRGSGSRSKRRQAAPGHGTFARMTPIGMTPSAHDSGSRRKNRHYSRRGSHVCTSKTVRGCVAPLEEILQTKDTWDHTYRILRPDGTVRWMQSLGRADRDATGHVTRLTGLELDITERRRTEDALQARRDEEHDRTLRTLLETATQGIVSADAYGVLVFANRASR